MPLSDQLTEFGIANLMRLGAARRGPTNGPVAPDLTPLPVVEEDLASHVGSRASVLRRRLLAVRPRPVPHDGVGNPVQVSSRCPGRCLHGQAVVHSEDEMRQRVSVRS